MNKVTVEIFWRKQFAYYATVKSDIQIGYNHQYFLI